MYRRRAYCPPPRGGYGRRGGYCPPPRHYGRPAGGCQYPQGGGYGYSRRGCCSIQWWNQEMTMIVYYFILLLFTSYF